MDDALKTRAIYI